MYHQALTYPFKAMPTLNYYPNCYLHTFFTREERGVLTYWGFQGVPGGFLLSGGYNNIVALFQAFFSDTAHMKS
jgi:hypothetical protein